MCVSIYYTDGGPITPENTQVHATHQRIRQADYCTPHFTQTGRRRTARASMWATGTREVCQARIHPHSDAVPVAKKEHAKGHPHVLLYVLVVKDLHTSNLWAVKTSLI